MLEQQQTVWYSLPDGHDLYGTNMKPGHMDLLVQTFMLFRQFMDPGEKIVLMLSPHAAIICQTSQNVSVKPGGL